MNIDQERFVKAILEACERAIKEGWTIGRFGFRDEERKRCCPLAALASDAIVVCDAVAARFGITRDQVLGIAHGIDCEEDSCPLMFGACTEKEEAYRFGHFVVWPAVKHLITGSVRDST